MTISNTTTSVTATGNGATTSWPYTFNIPLASQVVVSIYDSVTLATTTLTTSDYTITGLGLDIGGAVTYPLSGSPIASTKTITIQRVLTLIQDTDLENQGGYYPEVVEAALDYLTMVVQQQQTEIDNALAFPIGASTLTVAELIASILAGEANATAAEDAAAEAVVTAADMAADLAAAFPVVAANIGTNAVTSIKIIANAITAIKLATDTISPAVSMVNGTLVPSVAGNALTVALKTLAGTDPSATDPVYFVFRNATSATGNFVVRTVTAATTVVISSGSTLGFTSAVCGRLWVVAFDDAGTVRLGIINCRSDTSIYPLGANLIASSTAEGGAGAADSAHVFYTGAAVTSKAYSILGFLTWETVLTTAGTWDAVPGRAQLMNISTPLPGQQIQEQITFLGTMATGTTLFPFDNTIPQITEGDQYMTQVITPSSGANVLAIETQAILSSGVAGRLSAGLFVGATANAVGVSVATEDAVDSMKTLQVNARAIAGGVSALTYRMRAGNSVAGTTTFNGTGGVQRFGGLASSYLSAKELMA